MDNKLQSLSYLALLGLPFLWYGLYLSYKKEKTDYKEKLLFHKRHNCVVCYNPQEGMSGWPPSLTRIKPSIQNIDILYEPVSYFIETAKNTLDVAVMLLSLKSVINALKEAQHRGVKIRVIVNEENSSNLEFLGLTGLNIKSYKSMAPSGLNSIMHYKFMVKDYTKTEGYLLTGSLNMTNQGFLLNYENIVFTSDQTLIERFHNIFEDCWNYLQAPI